MKDIKLHKRLLKLLFEHNEEHVGSCFSCVDIIDNIFQTKQKDDIFILSNGHAAYALYCVLEKYYTHVDADDLVNKHGGHPHRCEEDGIYCSTGSLGMGLTVAIGRALADKEKKVYCVISDGECAEGSIWEGLKFIYENNLKNIEVYVSVNGYAAYDSVDVEYLVKRLKTFLPDIHIRYTSVNEFSFLKGLNAHYHIMNEKDYKEAVREINEKTV